MGFFGSIKRGIFGEEETAQKKRIKKAKKGAKKSVKQRRKEEDARKNPEAAKKKSKEKQNEVLDMLATEMKKRKNTDVLKF